MTIPRLLGEDLKWTTRRTLYSLFISFYPRHSWTNARTSIVESSPGAVHCPGARRRSLQRESRITAITVICGPCLALTAQKRCTVRQTVSRVLILGRHLRDISKVAEVEVADREKKIQPKILSKPIRAIIKKAQVSLLVVNFKVHFLCGLYALLIKLDELQMESLLDAVKALKAKGLRRKGERKGRGKW